MTHHGKRLLAASALIAAGWLAQPAHAITFSGLNPQYEGNMTGLAYRESDGHFLLTQDATNWSPTAWSTPLLYELDSTGQLVQILDLTTSMPGVTFTMGISVPASSGSAYIHAVTTVDDNFETFTGQIVFLSPDLSTMAGVLPLVMTREDTMAHVTDTEIITYNYFNDTVRFTSLATGDAQTVSVAGHFGTEDGCLDSSCIAGVAPSWSGGFFALDDAGDGRLMEFDRQGNLLNTMRLDYETFGYHPSDIDTDLSGHRIFLTMNSAQLVTLSEQDFIAAAVPEPATWASMGLGLIAMAGAAARARRQR